MTKTQLIKVIDERIENMSTKGVYYPRRLKPKWKSLSKPIEKLKLFEKYVNSDTSSIGFIRLMKVNLPEKTLESIIIENPTCCDFLNGDNIHSKCLNKFKRYKNGKDYLQRKGFE